MEHETSVFDYQDYKAYLAKLDHRGMKSAIAQAAQCQVAYVSRVLKGDADFSLEQAEAITGYLKLNDEESHFFLLLVQLARAGTMRLTRYFQKQIEEIQRKRLILKDRFQVKSTLTVEDQATYYSAWHYAAVHVLVSIPQFQTKEPIARHLGLSVQKVSEVLEFLVSLGLVVFERGHYRMGTTRIHLGNDSPLIAKHHTNWRIQALRSLDRDDKSQKNEDLHYSSIVSASDADAIRLKAFFVKAIEEYNAVVRDSKEEGLQCLALDFFRV